MELLYVLCQIAAADVCEEHRTPYASASPMACATMGQAELARLPRPGWHVAAWRCEGPETPRAPVTASAPPVPEAR
jgi:hypothetical protein